MDLAKVAVSYTEGDWAVVGVAEGVDGKGQMGYLRRQELAGECRLEVTNNVVLHEDNRQYRDVVVHSTHRADPQEIANFAWAFHPDND